MADYQTPQYAASATDVSETAAQSLKNFQRSYQACIPCRKRKVRCDLGPVNNPHEPPCARCRRESKECFFSATRRKRKVDGGDDESNEGDSEEPVHLARRKSARRQTSGDEVLAGPQSVGSGSIPPQSPLDQYVQHRNGSQGHVQQQPSNPRQLQVNSAQDQEVINEEAAKLFYGPITAPPEALHMLLDAAEISANGDPSGKVKVEVPSRYVNSSPAPDVTFQGGREGHYASVGPKSEPVLDPAITGHGSPSPSQESLKIWSRLRFVRAGWFTASEAIGFIDYYYKHLAPLTPITHPDLRQLESNPDLLSEEPVLTVTLLTIASRYMKVTGPGSTIRSLMIHEKLWQYLQNMVTRMFWGQEQFGGGFCGAGARKDAPSSADRTRLRTLGSIECLLLLSDFHPRSMHFPPSDDDEDILVPDEERLKSLAAGGNRAHLPGQSTLAGWTEPAVRSDRMSWSLICFAHTLAYELGIFGTYSPGKGVESSQVEHQQGQPHSQQRVARVDRLLYIYMTQACGRFGFPGMYPIDLADSHMKEMKAGFPSSVSLHDSLDAKDIAQQYWVEVISINKYCNDVLFQSRDKTGRYIQTGEYATRLQELVPRLQSWETRLHQAKVDRYTKTLLSIEINYFLVYVKGIALQAVLEQYTSKISSKSQATDAQSPASSVSSNISQLYSQNEDYIKGVTEASRKILLHVVDDLLPNDNLKHVPVRAVFRIVSAAMFLLKTFALGAKRSEVDKSLKLLKDTVSALRKSAVDDVHLSLRIADILETLTLRIGQKFIPYKAEISISPTRTSFSAAQPASPPHQRQNMRFVRQSRSGSFSQPSYLGAPDSTITVMPPPKGMYYNPSPGSYSINNASNGSSYGQSNYHMLQSPPPQMNTFSNSSSGYDQSNMDFPSPDDWMTLDLNPVMDPNGFASFGDNMLPFGNAVGPETHNSLDIVKRLVGEGWNGQGRGHDDNDSGFGL